MPSEPNDPGATIDDDPPPDASDVLESMAEEHPDGVEIDDDSKPSLAELWLSAQEDRKLAHAALERCLSIIRAFVIPVDPDTGPDRDEPKFWKLANVDGPLEADVRRLVRQACRTATHLLREELRRP